MIKQVCAICGGSTPKKILYKQNFNINDINKNVFSARRLPDGVHYKIWRCLKCGLVYSSPILPESALYKLYKKSKVTYGEQIADLTKTYGYYLSELEKYNVKKERLLEIGCGSGFLLGEAKRQGYKEVYGVELSKEAVEKAPKAIRKNIKSVLLRKCLFPKNYFNVICFFQTLDHISSPGEFLKNCFDVLKPGGLVLAFNHNISSLQARILGEKSPIIDIEHTYLYNLETMTMVFEKSNFQVLCAKPSSNIYSLDYLLYLTPLPKLIKNFLVKVVDKSGISKLKFKARIGNMVLIAKKQNN
ncbi:MAG: hypothetical protein A3D24_02490 [Candidatus Blackburnbacteria bacterium RIFCSPHIGHO2_02_FULL_39_13]|uniref:Methyltransferase type 11 domain-containing protein n=1 Tax=Candidatus Blackburnbacteria bacterium RIFCSPLOWO2_01_FULL_40_20 TaxID=1797519 RepID=A0A1G1VCJ6_9BACT|nr:MAG: Methyltransferase domain protein 12 [Microgenomates group bacterium GW2011_GWA2_39_19]OGY06890.1 MAG: hypothetical protein A2694_03280 [Candidatus Blackburnbacteria bacterium RIFCSPHIGHO2_01_FULL_40_17]OGY08371.1 MAG: hypothetical protein A3D24_02490 [Candidatus Blackburnbacteria bacterium RIFCSPHIGHO2_02_FULL_39_13]OGY13115.1 MAG: hypothetical protein A3A77_03955 [Candidatus Blackburnbacteria bacterium RIFCSPLOWO2_01_FULL_40_20]